MKILNKLTSIVNRLFVLNQFTIIVLVITIISGIVAVVFISQNIAEQNAFILSPPVDVSTPKEKYEIAKLAAEIRQIRSDTNGSLFWLKMVALFVTVGGAVGGYLLGQSQLTRDRIKAENSRITERLNFEHRKDVDAAYQAILQELSAKEAVLRAAAAVKLGSILQAFPFEWTVSDQRRIELIQLTKQVLAAALSIEKNSKVLKTITIALVLHKPSNTGTAVPGQKILADVRGLDLSSANAYDAYWARVDFSYVDFYGANLARTSFRNAVLQNAQFREAKLNDGVLINADCENANFKLADLRGADFTQARLVNVNFEGAKVYGIKLAHAAIPDFPAAMVDTSENGDGLAMISFSDWLLSQR